MLKAHGLRIDYSFGSETDLESAWITHRLCIGRSDAKKTRAEIQRFLNICWKSPVSTVFATCARYSSCNVARHLRINNLFRLFKNLADDNKIALLVAEDVSYLPEEEHETVYKVIDKRYDKNLICLPRQKIGGSGESQSFSGVVRNERKNVLRFYTKK